jgi:hypothetical protein
MRRAGKSAPSQGEGHPSLDDDAPPAERGGGKRTKLALLIAAAIAMVLVAVSAFLILSRLGGPSGPPKAAIVDQLSLSSPNPEFVHRAADLLKEAGYEVDYFRGEEVTVDLFRDLPGHDYELIVLRVHAGRIKVDDGEFSDDVSLFTAEEYSETAYPEDQKEGRLAATYDLFGSLPTFGIPAEFVRSGMRGDFDGATVILMGCDALRAETMAEAFVGRGAGAVVGWDDLVSTSHTDEAIDRLLEHLLIERLPIQDAVAKTMAEIGPDPAFGSTLRVYPGEG